jgi:tetratricopeptide (TPR) repeat protein
MIPCKHCQTVNGLDSKFCKSCGLALPEDAIAEAAHKHEQLLTEGYSLFNAARTSDAILVAQAAIEQNPNSAGAHSLLAMCFERTGQTAEALEEFERVLAINPDSALDRIKVTQLRSALTTQLKADTSRGSHRLALSGALMAVLLVSAIGAVFAMTKTPSAVAQSAAPSRTSVLPEEARPFSPTPQGAAVVAGVNPATDTKPDSQKIADNAVRKAAPLPTTDSPTDKADSGDDKSVNGAIPVTPGVPPGVDLTHAKAEIPQAAQAKTEAGQADPAPKEEPKQPEPPKETPGIIEIQVSHPRGVATSGAEGASPNQLQALTRAAREQFLLGRYDSAARSYERALAAGGDQASINQRLGMCYERLGKSGEAVAAYNRAANAYQVALNSGQGDSRRLKSGLDSCRQAIRMLKG